jgi:hypothetical protein
MIHEIRTYDLVPRGVPEFLEKTGAMAAERVKVTPLGGFFYTEVGALNQVVHICRDLSTMVPFEAIEGETPYSGISAGPASCICCGGLEDVGVEVQVLHKYIR